MTEGKKKIFNFIKSEGYFTIKCDQILQRQLMFKISDYQNLRACYERAEELPSHLDRFNSSDSTRKYQFKRISQESKVNVSSALNVLEEFQFKPEG